MKIFSCGSQGLLPSIPCVLPTCCSVQNELTFSGIAGSVPGILPLGAGYTTQQNATQTAAQTSAASSIFPLTAQTSASNPIAAENTPSAAATTAPSSASVQAAQGGNTAELFVQPQPGFMGSGASLADATEPAVQDQSQPLALMEDTTEKSASPSMTYEDAPEHTAKSAEDALASKMRSSAAQFLLHSSQAQNAGILPLQPQIISGDDIRFDQGKVLFTAAGLYFVAISLKADADKDSFVELIPQIAGALRQEYAAYSATVAGETGLAASFLLNTTNDKLPVSLELVLHTSATAPVHLEGCLSAFKVGVPENSLLDAAL